MYEENHFEAINSTLKSLNTSLERIGFNGAMVRDGYGGIEGLTIAIREWVHNHDR